MSHTEPHDEFLELCAVSTSGQLTQEERKKLDEHLAVCSLCREAIKEYESLVADALPAMAAEMVPEEVHAGPGWSQQRAEAALFDRIADEEGRNTTQGEAREDAAPNATESTLPFLGSSTWRNVWTVYAAALLLATALGICLYQVGMRRGVDSAKAIIPSSIRQNQTSLEAQLSGASHEREIALTQVAQRDHEIAQLRQHFQEAKASIAQMKAAHDQFAASQRETDTAKQALAAQQMEFKQKLEATEASAQSMQQKLDSLQKQSSDDASHAAQLTAQVKELTQLLHEREAALEEKDELLAKDRDIRELMGARDLYVAEVYDVNRTGKTQKPYGRVFLTRGKSLIFYAYDLDQDPDIKPTSTFQAWGQRGSDREKALSLGIFYEDNAAKKRWVVKMDDPKTLAQLDAVFVTVEPQGGSHKPSGTPLLFAYLKSEPNHP